jgi:hypothetical protein
LWEAAWRKALAKQMGPYVMGDHHSPPAPLGGQVVIGKRSPTHVHRPPTESARTTTVWGRPPPPPSRGKHAAPFDALSPIGGMAPARSYGTVSACPVGVLFCTELLVAGAIPIAPATCPSCKKHDGRTGRHHNTDHPSSSDSVWLRLEAATCSPLRSQCPLWRSMIRRRRRGRLPRYRLEPTPSIPTTTRP